MLTSLALIFLSGLAMNALCRRLRLPGIIGMLAAGMLLGPYALNLLDGQILDISPSLRQMALVVILLRAGLTLNLDDLKKVGRPAVLLSCVPAGCEILGYVLLAPKLLGISPVEAAVTGAVLSAVSPAVVVPRMVRLIDERRGTDKSIPQMILAGASCDDVFVIVLFSIFTSMAQGGQARAADFIGIPLSIVLGIALGAAAGLLLALFFRSVKVRGTAQLLILLSLSLLLPALETALKGRVPLSGLLAVMSMACALKRKSAAELAKDLSLRADKTWIAAEIVLFVLVGAAVDIRYTLAAGIPAVAMILLALVFRAAGVCLCMTGTALNRKERLFCVIAYLPKATVQAAIGSVPLAMGLPCGQIVLSVAVLAILITAPLGAIGMDATYQKLLEKQL